MAEIVWAGKPPAAIISRSKTCFNTPVRQWFIKGTGLCERGHRHWARVVYRKAQEY